MTQVFPRIGVTATSTPPLPSFPVHLALSLEMDRKEKKDKKANLVSGDVKSGGKNKVDAMREGENGSWDLQLMPWAVWVEAGPLCI